MKAFHEVRKYGSDFMVWYSEYQNINFLAHWHREIELIYIKDGEAHLSVMDQIFIAKKGDLIICDSGDIHYSDSNMPNNTISFLIFDPSIISSYYEYSNFEHPLVDSRTLKKLGLTSALQRLLKAIPKELEAKEPFYQDIIRALLREFWYMLKRKLPQSNCMKQSENRRNAMLNDLQQLLDYMDHHYTENITLESAAQKMNFSDSHFSKVFKKLTGINFVTYLNVIRIEHAASMLKNTSDKITDIALSCGFNNIRTFNRVFKNITGYTPTEFAELTDIAEYSLSYRNRKTGEQQFVENDSITLVKYSESHTGHTA